MPPSPPEATSKLALPLLAAGQAGKHVTVNEALVDLDDLVHLRLARRDSSAPPATPSEGEAHIIGENAVGAWAGRTGQVAMWRDGAWQFKQPQQGWVGYVAAEARMVLHDGTAWRDLPVRLTETDRLGIATSADGSNRLAVAAPATLLTHAGGSHRVTINKSEESETASLVFASNHSARAEIGLTGDNRLHLKTSPDGAAFVEGMILDSQGHVGINAQPTSRLTVKGGQVEIGWSIINAEPQNGGAALELMALGTGDRFAYVDFHATESFSDYASRLIRFPGTNGTFSLYNRGEGGIELFCEHGAPTRIIIGGITRLKVEPSGRVGIGVENPTAPLHVAGAARVGSYTVASLPPASELGAGSLIFVSDEAGGATLAFSDGAAWRRVTDRAVVT